MEETAASNGKRWVFGIEGSVQRWVFLCVAVFLAVATAFVYWEVGTKADFLILDSVSNIAENPSIRIPGLTPKALFSAAVPTSLKLSKNRPVPYMTFAVNYHLTGLDARPMRVFNAVVLFLCGLGVVFFAYLFVSRWEPSGVALVAAVVAGVLWTLHPLQTNITTYVVQRMTSLAILGYVWSFVFYLLGERRSNYYYLLAMVFALLGVLSKEIACVLPLSIFIYRLSWDTGLSEQLAKLRKYRWLAVAGGVLAVAAGVYWASGKYYDVRAFTLWERLLTQGRVLWHYVSLYFYPAPSQLNIEYDFALSTGLFAPATTMLAILAHGAVVALALALWRQARLVSLLLVLYYLHHLMESSVIGLELVFEHRMSLPAIYLSMLVALLVAKKLGNVTRSPASCMAAALVVSLSVGTVLGALTYQRNKTWTEPPVLWADMLQKSPNKLRPAMNLGIYHAKRKEYDRALVYFERILAVEPDNMQTLYNASTVYVETGAYEKGRSVLRRLLEGGDGGFMTLRNLAICEEELGNRQRALELNLRVQRVAPQLPGIELALARLYYGLGDSVNSLKFVLRELKRSPNNPEAKKLLAAIRSSRGSH